MTSLPTRLLHTLRRRAALRRLAHRRLSGTVLFVCLGNICRSPYAAATFSQGLGVAWRGRVRVDSAGFLGPGRSAPGHAVEVAADRGIDLSGHRSRLVSPEMWAGAELVVHVLAKQAHSGETGTFDVYTIAPDGSGLARLTSKGSNENPDWSPDGYHLVFSSLRGGERNLFTITYDGTNERQITDGGGFTTPAWGPYPRP